MTRPCRAKRVGLVVALVCLPSLAACGPSSDARPEPTPAPTATFIATATPLPSPTPEPVSVLDPTFGTDGVVRTSFDEDAQISDIALAPDGGIIAVGRIGFDAAVARYTADGALDPGFSGDGVLRSRLGVDEPTVNAVTVLDDGRILVGGDAEVTPLLARLDAAGRLDPSFGDDGVAVDTSSIAWTISDLALQTDGRIVTTGFLDRATVSRYLADGRRDPSFGANGTVELRLGQFTCGFSDVALRVDDGIVAGGTCLGRTTFGLLVRYASDGRGDALQLLPSQDVAGVPAVRDVAVDASGEVTLVGGARVVRMDAFGVAVPGFGEGGRSPELGADLRLRELAVDAAGRIVVAGDLGSGATGMVAAVGRITADGQPDETFAPGGLVTTPFGPTPTFASVTALALQPDRKIVVAVRSQGDFVVARYLSRSPDER